MATMLDFPPVTEFLSPESAEYTHFTRGDYHRDVNLEQLDNHIMSTFFKIFEDIDSVLMCVCHVYI